MLKRLILVSLLTTGVAFVAHAQRSLGSLVAEAGVEWLLGSWTAEADGNQLQLTFSAELDRHLGLVHYRDGRTETKGMIYLPAGSTEPRYVSVDNRGGNGSGSWSVEDGQPVLKYKQTNAESRTSSMGFKFRKVDSTTMEVGLYEIEAGEQLAASPRWTIEFKKK